MFDAVTTYFRSGSRMCLIGAFALTDTRDRFAAEVAGYFSRWIETLTQMLRHAGASESMSLAQAEDVVLSIQGAIMTAHALDAQMVFKRAIERMRARAKSWKG